MTDTLQKNPWEGDKLGFREIGASYTRLIKSIDEGEKECKVISIEAGFGHGKTFFRKAWAEHLRQQGEIVVEIDAQQSDHSGDPVVTFLGALLALIPESEPERRKAFWQRAKQVGAVGSKVAVNVLTRGAADQIGEALVGDGTEASDAEAMLSEIVDEVGKELSDYLGGLIAHQLQADKARTKELPEHLKVLFDTITEGAPNRRIVVIIDELDRCHPDYAIALLEAMKLVFSQPGFAFVLMVNADHLEALANRRFSDAQQGERYLDKFVDIRLQLPRTNEALGEAAASLVLTMMPDFQPIGPDKAFSVEAAADMTRVIAPASDLSMRQIKRVIMKVEVALRCHPDEPIDLPLLIHLAFEDALDVIPSKFSKVSLKRRQLTPERARNWVDYGNSENDYQVMYTDWSNFTRPFPEMRDVVTQAVNEHKLRGHDAPHNYQLFAQTYVPRHEHIVAATFTPRTESR
ncbi:KAP family NTPase [Yoonia sp. F2084L]|uniref:KAP family P-loop NTPase fold protein n=1 Tax=Yoonia sp. F2084L TaxID=2926419 RepID=UPI001FF285CF|nr:P-loop NTPase fold protein [Yoonia sp. F2084L]MCK0096480.1 KAP family NTPase [Yoonia sp. F2084L]